MANALYNTYKELILGAGLNLSSLDIRAALIDTGEYTFNAAHDFLNDVESGSPSAIISRSAALTGKSITNGVFDADNTVFSSVTGPQCEAVLLFRHTGSDATANLICYFDTGVTGLPVTPNGGDINVTWGANIFSL